MQTDTIYEYAPYADEYTLFDHDLILQEGQVRGFHLTVGQGGADGADAMAREWVLHNKKIGSQNELITGPSYSIRLPPSCLARHHAPPSLP